MNLSRLGALALVLFLSTAGAAEARTTVLQSSERELKLRIELPRAQLTTREVGRDRYAELTMEGMTTGGDPGHPGIPGAMTHFGIPQGADVSTRISNVESEVVEDVLLYPAQPDAIDDGSPAPPFTIDERAYASADPFPAEFSAASALGTMRDVRVGGLEIHGAQYTPRDRTLRVIESFDVTITFDGDNRGVFATTNLQSNWNIAFQNDYEALVNIETIRDHLELDERPEFCGEELLIVSSKELRPAAETLADSRRDQGYMTAIKEVEQIGTTPEQIQAFIQGELNDPDCLVHPSYVILLGNTAHVPTFEVPYFNGTLDANGDGIASDLPYSLNGIGDDYFADVQLGRVPAADLTAAHAVVEKLNRYATTKPAPVGDDFYRDATVTASFDTSTPPGGQPPPPGRDGRTFTMAAERARNGLRAAGHDVERLYFAPASADPQLFNDGTPMPEELRKPGFAWDADTSDFLNAFNRGRFVIMHRGHGSSYGWSSPSLSINDVPQMTNGTKTPVVFAINCASARFDDPSFASMVERVVMKPDGGSIAAFGDSRNSGSTDNTILATGFFDSMFAETDPEYDSGAPTRRLGDILVRGKQFFAARVNGNPHSIYMHSHLYGLFGDPTMQMWSKSPVLLDPNRFRAGLEYNGPDLSVLVRLESPLANGTVVTLFDGDEAVGRAVVRDGRAEIVPEVEVDPESLTVSAQQDGALPAQTRVEN